MPNQSAVEEAARAAREFGDAAEAVRQAAAARLDLNRTDFRILSAMASGCPVSAGGLATAVGLSRAATTEAVQRLVARGLLVRNTDPGDRRRAVITISPSAAGELDALFGPLRDEGRALARHYTADELAVITKFLEQGRDLQLAAAHRIRPRVAGIARQ